MTYQVLGGGCPNCKRLEANLKTAMADLKINGDVEKVTDMDQIMDMGVMMTPALAIDGIVKSSGKVLSVEEIKAIIS